MRSVPGGVWCRVVEFVGIWHRVILQTKDRSACFWRCGQQVRDGWAELARFLPDRGHPLYLDVLRAKRMCLCGMLAAEYQTLPQRMRDAVIHFFDANEAWLQRVVEQGQREGTLHAVGSSKEIARAIVGGLEGAMLVARPYGDVTRFQAATTHLLAGLIAGPIVNDGLTDGSRRRKKRKTLGG